MRRALLAPVLIACLLAGYACAHVATRTPSPQHAVLWRDPSRYAAAPSHPPLAPFRFIEEDFDGDSPKFFVSDAAGTRWQVKLGPEAQAESVAVRLVTALGFFAEETYFLEEPRIDGLARLTRGRQFVIGTDAVRHARFEARRETVTRGESWDWARNPFVGSLEFDALRATMVLVNNYDARTDNNKVLVLREGGLEEHRYVVADLGASFGQVGGMGGTRTKNDLEGYRHSPFIERVESDRVRFTYRTTPEGWARALFVVNPWYVAGERKKGRDLQSVPIPAARWLADRLRPLMPTAVRAAFREAGYPSEAAAGFVEAMTRRIEQLSRL